MSALDKNRFDSWVAQARPGDRLVYFIGRLVDQCLVSEQARLLRFAVQRAADDGEVLLVQARHNGRFGEFSYLAIRCGPRGRARAAQDRQEVAA